MAVISKTITGRTISIIHEDFPIYLINMDDTPELYYSFHGRLYGNSDCEDGLDIVYGLENWNKFSDIESLIVDALIDKLYVYNPTSESKTITYRDDYPTPSLYQCGSSCTPVVPIAVPAEI